MFKTNHVYFRNTQIQLLLDVRKALVASGTRILTPALRPDTVTGTFLIDQLRLFARRFHFVERQSMQNEKGDRHAIVFCFDMDVLNELCDAFMAGVYPAENKISIGSLTVACYILHHGTNLYWRAFGDIVGDKVVPYPCEVKPVGYLDLFLDKYRVTDRGHKAVEYWDRVSDIVLRKPEPVISETTNVLRFKR